MNFVVKKPPNRGPENCFLSLKIRCKEFGSLRGMDGQPDFVPHLHVLWKCFFRNDRFSVPEVRRDEFTNTDPGFLWKDT